MFIRYCTLFVFLIIKISYLYGQNTDKYTAEKYFKFKDYNRALILYLKDYKNDQNNIELNYNIGICYLNINNDKTKAIPYFKNVYNSGKFNSEFLLHFGLAYTYSYQFDTAVIYFNQYKNSTKLFTKKDRADTYIMKCENAKVLMKSPVDVTFTNLGSSINTEFPEYFPFVTGNQKTLFFTSSNEKNRRRQESSVGYYTSDIYYSSFENNSWSKATTIGNTINTIEDEQCVYVSPNGKKMIISIDNEEFFGDLFIAVSPKKEQFNRPTPFPKRINSKRVESEGCITEDGNTFFFSSNKRGGMGATDLYMAKKHTNGKWGHPINLGSNINTDLKEAFPIYDEKSGVLYFASEGHFNMGGFDIFKSKYDSLHQKFGPPINIGYPINTPEDNFQISVTNNGRDAYISAYKKGGFGDLDIYKVRFNKITTDESTVGQGYESIMYVDVHDTIINYVYIHDTIYKHDTIIQIQLDSQGISIDSHGTSIDSQEISNESTTNTNQKFDNGLVYRIQIALFKIPKNAFKGLENVYTETNSRRIKYFTGSFTDYTKAQIERNRLKKIGLVDAYVVPYYKGKEITIEKARSLEISNDSTTNINQKFDNELVYRIQIALFIIPKNAFKGLKTVYTETNLRRIKYFTGSFTDYNEALKERNRLKKIGLVAPFIVPYYNGKKITMEKARSFENKEH